MNEPNMLVFVLGKPLQPKLRSILLGSFTGRIHNKIISFITYN